MSNLSDLLDHNRQWAKRMVAERPDFFTRLSQQQSPRYMWVGCSDSRVPANQITGLEPGEVFVHRNVANVMAHSDLNALATVQYAVDLLKVEHLIICGHFGCGGVLAALNDSRIGLADNWIRHVQDVRDRHHALLESAPQAVRGDLLCKLNVIEQAVNVARSTVLQDAWARGQNIAVHGWIYGVHDGLLHDLLITLDAKADVAWVYRSAVAAVVAGAAAAT
jgi:carbonic anhydrase